MKCLSTHALIILHVYLISVDYTLTVVSQVSANRYLSIPRDFGPHRGHLPNHTFVWKLAQFMPGAVIDYIVAMLCPYVLKSIGLWQRQIINR